MLTWYDYPADVNSAAQLVNDLDLTVGLGGGRDGSPPQSLMGNNPEGARECTRAADTVDCSLWNTSLPRPFAQQCLTLSPPPSYLPLSIPAATCRSAARPRSPEHG